MPFQRTPSAQPKRVLSLELARWRERRKLSLDEIAETTKISLRFLKAIEAEDFGQLPGGIFNTSYLRQYAAAVGFDERKLLAHYERQLPSGESNTERQPRTLLDRWLRLPAASRS